MNWLAVSTEVVRRLVGAKAEINAVHPEGVNALMYAAAGGHLPVVAYLIQNGAEVRREASRPEVGVLIGREPNGRWLCQWSRWTSFMLMVAQL